AERLLAEATPGPWEAYDAADGTGTHAWGVGTAYKRNDSFEVSVVECDFVNEADARLIAAARNLLPELIAERRELLDSVAKLESELSDLRNHGPLLDRTMTVRELLNALDRFVGFELVTYDTGESPD